MNYKTFSIFLMLSIIAVLGSAITTVVLPTQQAEAAANHNGISNSGGASADGINNNNKGHDNSGGNGN